jgi:hypothetical protein
MHLKKRLVMGLVIVSLWTMAGRTQPAWGFEESRAGHSGMLLRLLYKVGLTEAQKAQLQGILVAHRPTLHALRSQLQTIQEETADKLLGPEQVQEADLQPLALEANRLREQLAQEWRGVMLEVRAILTPAQLAQAAQLKDQLGALRHEMQSLLGERP